MCDARLANLEKSVRDISNDVWELQIDVDQLEAIVPGLRKKQVKDHEAIVNDVRAVRGEMLGLDKETKGGLLEAHFNIRELQGEVEALRAANVENEKKLTLAMSMISDLASRFGLSVKPAERVNDD